MSDPDNNIPPEPFAESEHELEFTGERVVPGKVDPDLFNEHFARYVYARGFCSGQRVLDTGCGVGYGSAYLAKLASLVVGLDNDRKTMQYASSRYGRTNMAWVVGNCQQLPFLPHTFDVVTSFELIEHLPDADAYLGEVRRVLREGGAFLVSTPNRPVYHEHLGEVRNPFHIREWDHDEFVALLKNYFKFVEVLGEKHLSAVGVIGNGPPGAVPAVVEGQTGVQSADYFVCVCSGTRQERRDLVLVPASANVLQERERHIRSLAKELKDRETYLAHLQPDFESMAAWATKLNAELAEAQGALKAAEVEVNQLRLLWSRATRWKRALVFSALAPLDWAVAAVVMAAELAGRLWRLLALRPMPSTGITDPTRASIIVLSWEGKHLLAESLPPLLRAVRAHGGEHEVIVLDNGSTDGTKEYVESEFPEVRVVRSERNIFYTGGNNLGAQQARNDIIVLLNNDMIVDENFLAPLLQGFRSPEVFAVASQVFLADPCKPREETGKTRATFNGCDFDWRHDPISPGDEQQKYVPVFWGHGGAVAIDRQKFVALGGLDTLYDPFYVEDSDLSYRAWKAGWRCLLAVHSKVIHKHRGTNAPRYGTQFISQIVHRNQYLFLWKNIGDLGMLLAHFRRAARWRMRRAGMIGVGIRLEWRALLGAVERLPAVIRRRFQLSSRITRTDEQILALANAASRPDTSSSEVDFSRGIGEEQLGTGWYPAENHGGHVYRWMGKNATLYLRAPSEETELYLSGYMPSLSRGKPGPRILSVACGGRQWQSTVNEGAFEQHYRLTGLKSGNPVEVELTVDTVIEPSSTDKRRLGAILNRMALISPSPGERGKANGEPASHEVRVVQAAANPHPEAAAGQRRILMLCAYLPCLGVHSGGNTMFNLIRTLSKRHRITVLSFYEREHEKEAYVPLLAPYCERLEVLYRGQVFDKPNLLGLIPSEIVHEFYHKRMDKLVREYLLSSQFDVLQCEFLQMGHFACVDPNIPAVLTNHEVVSLSYSNRFHDLPWTSRGKLKAMVSWMRMLNYEEKLLRRFAAVVVLTAPEREFLLRYAPHPRVYAHPTGVDCEFFSPSDDLPEKESVVFVGNFRHGPNVSGITWFLQRVWPRVREAHPSARLYIVGGNPPPSLKEVHGSDGIYVTDWVRDIRPYLQQSAVFVSPVFEGVGLRGKVLEAWAMKKAVVGTRLAFEALGGKDGENCFMTDDAATFAGRICQLLDNQELAARMGERARQGVVSSFSWDSFGLLYDKIYQDILGSGASSGISRESSLLQSVITQCQ